MNIIRKGSFRTVRVSIAVLILLEVSCSGNPQTPALKKTYFDLAGFFDQQIETLYKDSFIVLKTARINDKTDQHEMPWTDWRKELALFYASDINKASYIGKYSIDTIRIDSSKSMITFSATDSSLRTRLMKVTYSLPDNAVTLLHIINRSRNVISANNEELFYEPLKTYIIKSDQRMKIFGTNSFAVKGDIVQKQRTYF